MRRFARRAIRRIKHILGWSGTPVSDSYTLLEQSAAVGLDGWRMRSVAERQHQAFAPFLQDARAGQPRLDFIVAAQAISATDLTNPFVIEVGCGSGYYAEMLPLLLKRPIRYIGLDYATSMINLAHQVYPNVPFFISDACRMPISSNSCDILLSGTSLMHIVGYRQAITESARISRKWCIFHTVPVMARRTTTFLRKHAYGEPVIEVIFNQAELEDLITKEGLVIQRVWNSIPYDIKEWVGEPTWTLSYLCRK